MFTGHTPRSYACIGQISTLLLSLKALDTTQMGT
jgi:hypothetical protein